MGWLTDNPVFNMRGPEFLVFYAILIVVIITVGFLMKQRLLDESGGTDEAPRIPHNPDPYELAYLRGGVEEVTRLGIFELLRRGVLVRVQEKEGLLRSTIEKVAQAPPHKGGDRLDGVELVVYNYFSEPRKPEQVFQGLASLPSRLKSHCQVYDARLQAERLMVSQERRMRTQLTAVLVVLAILAMGGLKLLAALEQGRSNVGFLILLGLVGAITGWIVCRPRRLSRRGVQFLESLRLAFSGNGISARPGLTGDPALLALSVALFGFTALNGTVFADYNKLFTQHAGTNGCGGAGCGSESSSSGGCGGGDGGGGGCGGCGGD